MPASSKTHGDTGQFALGVNDGSADIAAVNKKIALQKAIVFAVAAHGGDNPHGDNRFEPKGVTDGKKQLPRLKTAGIGKIGFGQILGNNLQNRQVGGKIRTQNPRIVRFGMAGDDHLNVFAALHKTRAGHNQPFAV